MSDYKVSTSELARLQLKFSQFDKEGNGELESLDEVSTALRAMGLTPTKAEIMEFLNQMQAANKKVGFNEVVRFVESIHKDLGVEEQLRLAFNCFDREGTGVLPVEILREAMCVMTSDPLGPDEFEELVRETDIEGAGEIKYEDLKRVLCSNLHS
mmetsp:Transcript_3208/g.3584  ORF Transcript_3208/g.3584 Transcript_3208/m.3584 type:complete len:155 (-) Transcript_3208:283-747(-)|eukprot:CAMPEP_0197866268 /NCGR_PEP_ID=MMETSP1438-20131217/44124_1 /TAXON_ID=1461541 /ORGANISM="Pterosperma sp., Strain CCMP1384" /LENGTH=154 /DNA_ID=CAMNT_0043484823 /DNA_START=420 /DNA_END=884 /DNA_ORIENTATION=-